MKRVGVFIRYRVRVLIPVVFMINTEALVFTDGRCAF